MNMVITAVCVSSLFVVHGALGIQAAPVPLPAPQQNSTPVAGQLLTPPSPPPAAPNSLVSAPGPVPGGGGVSLVPTTETAVLSSPVPTISPTWGYRVAVIGDEIFATGPERAMSPGSFGQLCTWTRTGTTTWKADANLVQLARAQGGDVGLQRLERGGPFIFTAVNRDNVGTTVRVLKPSGGKLAEVAEVALPTNTNVPTFGSSFASDGATLAVGSADMRFSVLTSSTERVRDPKVYIYSNRQGIWNLDGFVKAPTSVVGTPSEAMWFGAALDVDADVLAVGRPATLLVRHGESMPISIASRVHVYRRLAGQWMPEAELLGAAVTDMQSFGIGVAVEGDTLIVRGIDSSIPETTARVWVYARIGGSWVFRQELVPAAGITPGRAFGTSMAISKGHIVIGDTYAHGADEIGDANPGMALLFEERDGRWVNTARLMPAAPCMQHNFGNDVAVDWPIVVVGRTKSERLGLEPGGAYVFDLSGSGQAVSPRPQ